MGHSRYTLDAAASRDFVVQCYASNQRRRSHVQIVTNDSFVYLLLSDSQLEALHAAIQQRVTQIVARRMNEAQAAEEVA